MRGGGHSLEFFVEFSRFRPQPPPYLHHHHHHLHHHHHHHRHHHNYHHCQARNSRLSLVVPLVKIYKPKRFENRRYYIYTIEVCTCLYSLHKRVPSGKKNSSETFYFGVKVFFVQGRFQMKGTFLVVSFLFFRVRFMKLKMKIIDNN